MEDAIRTLEMCAAIKRAIDLALLRTPSEIPYSAADHSHDWVPFGDDSRCGICGWWKSQLDTLNA